MLATFNKVPIFFILEVQSVKLRCIHLQLCHIAIAVRKAHSFWQFGVIFSMIKIRHQLKNGANH